MVSRFSDLQCSLALQPCYYAASRHLLGPRSIIGAPLLNEPPPRPPGLWSCLHHKCTTLVALPPVPCPVVPQAIGGGRAPGSSALTIGGVARGQQKSWGHSSCYPRAWTSPAREGFVGRVAVGAGASNPHPTNGRAGAEPQPFPYCVRGGVLQAVALREGRTPTPRRRVDLRLRGRGHADGVMNRPPPGGRPDEVEVAVLTVAMSMSESWVYHR